MYSKLKLSELKNTNFKTKHHFLYKIVKVLEMANFTFLANFRFLTLPCCDILQIFKKLFQTIVNL